MQSVQLKVNEEKLVKHLRLSFSNATTVLGELMQNARRAHATQVAFDYDEAAGRLCVTDDGCGIADMQMLVSIADSGWDAETLRTEHPFGMGFLAAVYAAEHLTVESGGARIDCDTARLLAFEPVRVESCEGRAGTRITLQGVRIEGLAAALRRLAYGFSIPVLLNSEPLPRPHARDSRLRFITTTIGACHVRGLTGRDDFRASTARLTCYLQGLPVYSGSHWEAERANVVHLDASRFQARLPDRDKLIDEQSAVAEVQSVIRSLWQAHLRGQKTVLAPEAFVERYEVLSEWGVLELLNDVPLLPKEVLGAVEDYPVQLHWPDSMLAPVSQPVRLDDVVSGEVKLARLETPFEESPARWMFAWQAGYLVLQGRLDAGHWAHALAQDLDALPLRVELLGPVTEATFCGAWLYQKPVRFCEAYRIHVGDDAVEIEDAALYYVPDDAAAASHIIVPSGESGGRVVRQATDFTDGDDHYLDRDADEEVALFEIFILSVMGRSARATLEALLPTLRLARYPVLAGRRFSVSIDEDGRAQVEELF